jgi:hypothetical protein
MADAASIRSSHDCRDNIEQCRPRRDETVAKDNGRSTAIYLRGLKDHGGDGASGSARRIISDKFFFDGRSGSIDVAQADALLMAESLQSRQPNRFRVRLLLKTCKKTLASLLRFPISRFQTPLVKFHVNRLI